MEMAYNVIFGCEKEHMIVKPLVTQEYDEKYGWW
jgi:hypothetical protein